MGQQGDHSNRLLTSLCDFPGSGWLNRNRTKLSSGSNGDGRSNTPFNSMTGALTLTATGNTISQTDGNGILLVGCGVTGVAKLKIQNNTVAAPPTGVRPGIRVDAGNAASVNDSICLDISGNTSTGSGNVAGIGLRKQGTVTGTNAFSIVGMAATSTPGVEQYVGNGQEKTPAPQTA
jgi:hypothetical protein